MSFKSWLLGNRNTNQNTGSSFFYSLLNIGGVFNHNTLSDKKALEGFLSSAALYTVAMTAAKGVASLPLVLATEDSNGELTPIVEGEFHDLIFYPNQDQTLSELWELQSLYYFVNGEWYNYHDRTPGFLDGRLISLPPSQVQVITNNQNSILSEVEKYIFQDNGKNITILPEDMLHVVMPNPSTLGRANRNGLSPLQAGQNLVNASINTETFQSWYFENRGVSNIISGNGNPTTSLQPKDEKLIRKAINAKFGGAHRANSLEIVQNPVTVTQLNASSTDMQTIQNYNLVVERLAALIGLPAILVQINENSTYNNVVEAKKQAYHELYIPTAERFIRGYERTYLKAMTERTGKKHVLYVDTDKIQALQPSPFEKRKEDREDVKTGILSRNEARLRQGLEALPENEMDVPTIQNNLIPINTIENEPKS